MKPETLDLLCNPYTEEPFYLREESLIGTYSGQTFPIKNGIPNFILPSQLTQRSKLLRWFYNIAAFAYDPILSLGQLTNTSTENEVRKEYITNLPVNKDDYVFESAVGTGSNFLELPDHGNYFGLDLSWGMLKQAQNKLIPTRKNFELFMGDGAYLPFRDNSFDLVFMMGGLQFMTDPFRSVSEMARIAKPGSTIHILDESSGAVRTLRPMPAHSKYSSDKSKAVEAMPRLIPKSMTSIRSEMLDSGDYYSLSFKKPL